jgi:hypothetical protein
MRILKWPAKKIQKKYIAFFALTPLLLLVSLVKTTCPICDGAGVISSSGMGKVTVARLDSTLLEQHTVQGCLNYVAYTYNIVLTLQNGSDSQDASGYVRMALVDYKTSKILATQYASVIAPKSTMASTGFQVVFTTGLQDPTTTTVMAEPVLSNAKCKSCNGTGKVALNYLPLLRNMKQTFTDVQRLSTIPIQLAPANMADLPEILVGQEYNTDQWIIEHPNGQW